MANIINREVVVDRGSVKDIRVNKDIINISNLKSIRMIFFRHQHMLIKLNKIMRYIIFIKEFSTSKVDIFINYLELLIMLRLLLGLFFVRRVQPMFIIRILIIIILVYSYILYILLGGYWFSYALVIVMLRGVLVVFTYIVRLIPNERFEEYNILYILGITLFMVGGSYIWVYQWKYSFVSLNLWRSFFRIFNIFIVRFLLLIILLVVWLRYYSWGALRVY